MGKTQNINPKRQEGPREEQSEQILGESIWVPFMWGRPLPAKAEKASYSLLGTFQRDEPASGRPGLSLDFAINQGAIQGLYQSGILRGTPEKGPSGGSHREADGLKCFWCPFNMNALETLF